MIAISSIETADPTRFTALVAASGVGLALVFFDDVGPPQKARLLPANRNRSACGNRSDRSRSAWPLPGFSQAPPRRQTLSDRASDQPMQFPSNVLEQLSPYRRW